MRVGGEPAFLAIADVSGYTSYLAGVELDHATDVLADLVGTVVDGMAPFRLSKLEGDAAFAWLPAESIDPSTLLDLVEGTYLAFRTRLRDITQASRCECNACILIPSLDLKLIVHHGLVARQRMAGLEELVGSDVILVHRLLKNDVAASTGLVAYAIYTQAAIDASGIDAVSRGMREHHETTDVAGDVTVWVQDLASVWQAFMDRPRQDIPLESVGREWTFELPVPVPVAWEYVTSPARRPIWTSGVSEIVEVSPDGRRGIGTTNHCMHGKDVVIERILDWQPPHYWLVRSSLPEQMGGIDILMSDELSEADPDTTRVTLRVARGEDTSPQRFDQFVDPIGAMLDGMIPTLQGVLREVAAERARQSESEPVVPASEARYLTSPVTRAAESPVQPSV